MFRKISFCAVFFIILSVYASALTWSDIKFSAGTSTDYYAGQVREIVYPGSGWANDYLSELTWQIDNIVMLSGHFGAFVKNFTLSLSGSTAVTKGTGQMDDYDWLDYTSKTWTNWSNSDIFLDKSFILDSSLSYNIKPSNNITIPVGIGYKLNYLSWSDKAGKFIYFGYLDDSYNYVESLSAGVFGGIPGIEYTFVQNIPFLSAGVTFLSGSFSGAFNASYSPYVYAWDLDHHLINKDNGASGTFYLDSFTAHLWYRLEASLSYSLKSSGAVKLAVRFEELPEVSGNVTTYDEDPSDSSKIGSYVGTYSDGAGLASKILTISIGYTYRF